MLVPSRSFSGKGTEERERSRSFFYFSGTEREHCVPGLVEREREHSLLFKRNVPITGGKRKREGQVKEVLRVP